MKLNWISYTSLLILSLLIGCSSGFSDTEISDIQAEIKLTYEKKGWNNVEVALVRETDSKLTGFVNGTIKTTRYETRGFGMFSNQVAVPSESKITNECTANKDIKNKKYFWQCKLK
jgi:hypothetical protein